jgi:tetratricopeptide (TPR) repeat protein
MLWSLLLVPAALSAAPGDEFYQRLYQRGMAHFAAADYAAAVTELRNAAFGFVEQVDQFETAEAYASIAAHRLGHDADARDTLMRIVAAEKVQPHFRSVKLPDDLRAEIDVVAATLLTKQEATLLGVPQQVQDAAGTKPAVVVPTPTKAPNVAVTAPREDRDVEAVPPAAKPVPPAPAPQPAVSNADTSLADAGRAADSGDVACARSIYNALLNGLALTHAQVLSLADGLYRARDFAGAARAFQRAGTFAVGEESHHYEYAVTLYETGHFSEAKQELAAALPYITVTSDVARYRAKIEAATE